MAGKNPKKRDSIFDSTANGAAGKKADKPVAKPAAKADAPAPKVEKPAKTAAPEFVIPPPTKKVEAAPPTADQLKVLTTLLKNHEREVLYRKSKEDKMLLLGLALVAGLALGAFVTRAAAAGDAGTGWFYSLVYRVIFAVMTGVSGFAAAAMIELNRTRLQDLLAMIVKIQERLNLFAEDAFGPGAFLPSSYKFIGSINDDETNYSLLVLKVGAVVAAVAVFLLV